jgi:hypothetical protein
MIKMKVLDFATFISVTQHFYEKREGFGSGSVLYKRIRDAQKYTDPTDPDPEHFKSLKKTWKLIKIPRPPVLIRMF